MDGLSNARGDSTVRASDESSARAVGGAQRREAPKPARRTRYSGRAPRDDAGSRAPDRSPRIHAAERRGEPCPLAQAVRCAFDGVAYTLLTQRNFRIQLGFALAAAVLCWILRVGAVQAALVAVCAASVLAAECANTALESVVDLVTSEYSELARRAKDCAAGAVLVLAMGSVVVALLVFAPALAALLAR